MLDSVAEPTVLREDTTVTFRLFGACATDALLVTGRESDRATVIEILRSPEAPQPCDHLEVNFPVGYPPPDDSAGEARFVIRHVRGAELLHVVKLQNPQEAPWWPQRCRWTGPVCYFYPYSPPPRTLH